MFKNWLAVRRKNYELLRYISEQIRKEFEKMPYAILADPSQPISYERVVEGIKVSWSADVPRQKQNGDIYFSMEFNADLPTILGVKPTYSFWKKPDDSVYY